MNNKGMKSNGLVHQLGIFRLFFLISFSFRLLVLFCEIILPRPLNVNKRFSVVGGVKVMELMMRDMKNKANAGLINPVSQR
jgi:hypothetical protein